MARHSSHYGALRLAASSDAPGEQVLSVCIQPDGSYQMRVDAVPRLTVPPTLGVMQGFGPPERILPCPVQRAPQSLPRYAGLRL